ncbi:hypothetical protein C2G38_2151224 [Gigaspora rosea]|uniref:Uncharacterized protein n=1 Tax=Gigaspora rosea TaxID=44941 RepID=A0A397W9B8_9GLOM|nr:hypothetical protein C2G38_2151224 [Gigaspora rosea]
MDQNSYTTKLYKDLLWFLESFEYNNELFKNNEFFNDNEFFDDNEFLDNNEFFNDKYDESSNYYEIEILEEFEMPTSFTSSDTTELLHCAIIDYDDNLHIIQRCNQQASRSIKQLCGTWEVYSLAMKQVKNNFLQLKVCYHHLNYDKNTVHKVNLERHIKAIRTTEVSDVAPRRYLFCKKFKYFFTRGITCASHIWKVCGCTIQAPYRGLFNCPAISECKNLLIRSFTDENPRFICTNCLVTHLHAPKKRKAFDFMLTARAA